HGLDDLDQVIVGLLGEDEDDGGARLGVVLADVAQRGARLFAGDGLHLEWPADLLARAGLQFVRVGPLEREAEGDGQSRNDHQTHRRSSTSRSIEWKWVEEPPLSPLGGDVESAPEVYPCRGRVLQAVPPRGFGRGRAPSRYWFTRSENDSQALKCNYPRLIATQPNLGTTRISRSIPCGMRPSQASTPQRGVEAATGWPLTGRTRFSFRS